MKKIRLKELILRGHIESLKDYIKRKSLKGEGEGISTTDLVNKIHAFCELASGVKYYPYQEQFGKRIIRSVLENDGLELTALFARQMGN